MITRMRSGFHKNINSVDGHVIAIGDVHGENVLFRRLLEEVEEVLQPHTKVVFLGDLIDRGPSSCDVVRQALNFRKRYGEDRVIMLPGNHELMFYDGFFKGERDALGCWLMNGGNKVDIEMRSDDGSLEVMTEYACLIPSMPSHVQFGKTIFVHAGVTNHSRDRVLKREQHWSEAPWAWTRSHIGMRVEKWFDDPEISIVHGHTITTRSKYFDMDMMEEDIIHLDLNKTIKLDVGSFLNHQLCFAEFKDDMFRINVIQQD